LIQLIVSHNTFTFYCFTANLYWFVRSVIVYWLMHIMYEQNKDNIKFKSVAILQKVPIISLNVQLLHLPLVGFKARTHIVDICASPSFSLVVVIIIIVTVVVAIGHRKPAETCGWASELDSLSASASYSSFPSTLSDSSSMDSSSSLVLRQVRRPPPPPPPYSASAADNATTKSTYPL